MQGGSYFIHLIAYNIMVKTEFQIYCKYIANYVNLKIIKNLCK
jgi:hypothetical protein